LARRRAATRMMSIVVSHMGTCSQGIVAILRLLPSPPTVGICPTVVHCRLLRFWS
jgi:hypothetical protein